MSIALLQVLLFAANAKFAMVGFVAGEGISDASFRAVSDTLAGELRQQSGGQLITADEIKSLLSVEEQKQMVGCTSESCFAEIGGALGAERIVSGSIGKVGKSWMLVVKAIHSKRVGDVKQVTRRIKDGSIDDVLDVIAPAVRELLGGAVVAAPTPEAPKGQAFDSKLKSVPSTANLALTRIFGDGRGRFLAIEPKTGSSARIFYGTTAGLYQQRIFSAGSNGPTASYEFWDPRYVDGWQHQILVVGEEATVQCGAERKVSYKLLKSTDAAPVYKASLFAPFVPFRSVLLAVDTNGVYYYVDASLGDKPQYRLFTGKKGAPTLIAVDNVLRPSDDTMTVLTASGKLVVKGKSTEWIANGSTLTLDAMNLYLNAPFAFTELGVYPKVLQTPCDE